MTDRKIFAEKLMALGFTRYTPIDLPPDDTEYGELLCDEEASVEPGFKRSPQLPENTPMFVALDDGGKGEVEILMTFAWDESGDQWLKMGVAVDLTIYGFINPLHKVSFN